MASTEASSSSAIEEPNSQDQKPKRKITPKEALTVVVDTFWIFIFSLLTIAIVFAVVVPILMGATPTTILTQSMEPTMKPGDIVMVEKSTPLNEVQIGDVVSIYERSGEEETFTHRVTGITLSPKEPTGYSFITQGDNNKDADEPIRGERIKGKVINWPGTNNLYIVPKLGWIINYPYHVIGLFTLYFLWVIVSSFMSKSKERKREAKDAAAREDELAQLRDEMARMKANGGSTAIDAQATDDQESTGGKEDRSS